ncbi:tRNA (adenosine(37)-N6)-threonylcarbamoyltransferase complex transferase subunit TsaD [bacterium]|nr:tRNA (adenosine(37)-N6)-threonylcarbamoyltransferase complex transferase subunit TsaD [bacterium]
MIVLGIETSCDDTSAAIFDGQSLRSNIISTQLIHQRFGGIVPELASRSHIQLIMSVIKETLNQTDLQLQNLQGIAVTYGPGLAGSLLVGLSVAKGLALSLRIPFIGINHLEGHVWANRLDHPEIDPPFIVLIASGGHTQLVLVKDWRKYKVLGRTRDDAAGEAYDKIGKLLGIGFPGGPAIEKLAKKGNPNYVRFPRAFLEEGSLDFSFSGLKTAVLNHTIMIGPKKTKEHLSDIALCFQDAVIDILTQKSILAAKKCGMQKICLAGGVAVNKSLQKQLILYAKEENMTIAWPLPVHCTDNAGMIACVGHDYLQRRITSSLTLSPAPSLNL